MNTIASAVIRRHMDAIKQFASECDSRLATPESIKVAQQKYFAYIAAMPLDERHLVVIEVSKIYPVLYDNSAQCNNALPLTIQCCIVQGRHEDACILIEKLSGPTQEIFLNMLIDVFERWWQPHLAVVGGD